MENKQIYLYAHYTSCNDLKRPKNYWDTVMCL